MATSTNPFADEPLPQGQRLQSVGDPLNPYAAPVNVEPTQRREVVGVWRDGPLLVMHRSATLPERCVVSGEPTTKRHFETVRWTKPVDWGDRALVVEYGIRPDILRTRNRLPLFPAIISAGVWIVVMVVMGFLVQHYELEGRDVEDAFSVGVVISAIGTAICFLPYLISRMQNKCIRLVDVDRHYLWLRGPSEEFLRTLPPWSEARVL